MAKQQSKFFRVAVEGATSDGRVIDRDWLEQIAKNYDPAVYGARVNVEHIRGYSPNSDFRAFGDVTAVRIQQDDIGGKKKAALYAQIVPTAELIELTKRKQKIYTSIEVRPSFADTNEAYLTGLAVTDNPASLGTEVLAFAAGNRAASPFAGRKDHPDDLFVAAVEASLEFEAAPDEDGAGIVAKFRSSITAALAKLTGKAVTDDARFAAVSEGFTQIGDHFAAHVEANDKKHGDTATAVEKLNTAVDELQKKYAALDTTEADPRRPLATGGNSAIHTDY